MRSTTLQASLLAVVFFGLAGPAHAASHTLYVSAAAKAEGDGSKSSPFRTLPAVEQASAPGDVIVVLPASAPLDGGIALKPGQKSRAMVQT